MIPLSNIEWPLEVLRLDYTNENEKEFEKDRGYRDIPKKALGIVDYFQLSFTIWLDFSYGYFFTSSLTESF